MAKFRARWRCHRSLLCCQYCDGGNCNSPFEEHTIARWVRWPRHQGFTWTCFQGYWRHNLRVFSWTCKYCRENSKGSS